MSKNIFQDIVPPEKRSIRNIPLPSSRTKKVTQAPQYSDIKSPAEENVRNEMDNDPKIYPYEDERKRRFKINPIWIAGGVSVLIILFAILSIFKGATVSVTPKAVEAKVTPDKVFSASLDTGNETLNYKVVTVSKDAGKLVAANGEEKAERKASGKIVIFNTYDANSQRLIKNTRFETPEGLIYRINESVVVPGRTGSGAQMSPGSVEVTVYADEAGDKYNIGLKDFSIPGFKGDPRYKAIYARSKTEMTGGFVGMVKKVAENDLKKTEEEIQNELKDSLKKEAQSQVPDEFVIFDDGLFYSFESLPQTDASNSEVKVNVKGNLNAVIFDKQELANYLSENLDTSIKDVSSTIENIDSINFAIKDKNLFNVISSKTFEFTVNNSIRFIAKFDPLRLKGDLAGQPKKELNTILAKYPGILRANASIRPFWKRSFPANQKDINVKILDGKTE